MMRIRHILVPTDFSTTSDAALDYARDIAARFNARLSLLHVLQDPFVNGPLVSPTSARHPACERPSWRTRRRDWRIA